MKTIIVIVLAAAVLLVGMTAMNASATTHGAPRQATTTQHDTTSGVTGAPSLSATQVDSILCSADSPACNTGQSLYDGSLQYDIDDAYALAFFQHESSFGLYGVAHVNLGLGNIRCSAGYVCKSGFRAYASWQDGYADWYQLINWYIQTLHKNTLEQIVTTYAPSTENDTTLYIQSVQNAVTTWRATK